MEEPEFIMQNTTLSLLSMLGTFLVVAAVPLSQASAEAPEEAEAPAEAETSEQAAEEAAAAEEAEGPAEPAEEAEAPAQEEAAADAESPTKAPAPARKLGGHLGLALPILTVGTPGTSVIGRDFGVTGIVAGINLGLTAKWSIDFEFIVLGDFKPGDDPAVPSTTLFVLDPGVVYNAGFLFAGIRAAMRVPAPLGGAEFGFVPIIGKAFRINDYLSYYIELDLPLFAHSTGDVTFTTLFQTGFGF